MPKSSVRKFLHANWTKVEKLVYKSFAKFLTKSACSHVSVYCSFLGENNSKDVVYFPSMRYYPVSFYVHNAFSFRYLLYYFCFQLFLYKFHGNHSLKVNIGEWVYLIWCKCDGSSFWFTETIFSRWNRLIAALCYCSLWVVTLSAKSKVYRKADELFVVRVMIMSVITRSHLWVNGHPYLKRVHTNRLSSNATQWWVHQSVMIITKFPNICKGSGERESDRGEVVPVSNKLVRYVI